MLKLTKQEVKDIICLLSDRQIVMFLLKELYPEATVEEIAVLRGYPKQAAYHDSKQILKATCHDDKIAAFQILFSR